MGIKRLGAGEACLAHNQKVGGSKPPTAKFRLTYSKQKTFDFQSNGPSSILGEAQTFFGSGKNKSKSSARVAKWIRRRSSKPEIAGSIPAVGKWSYSPMVKTLVFDSRNPGSIPGMT